MQFSALELIDLLVRFFALGQLVQLGMMLLRRPLHNQVVLGLALIVCFSGYLLLTAKIPDEDYGALRGVFLLLTELMPFVIWCFAFVVLRDDFDPRQWSLAIKVFLALIFAWFVYFFGIQQGRGLFHQICHLIQLLFMAHVVVQGVIDWRDDLVSSRRKVRLLLLVFVSLYVSMLSLLELTDASFRDSAEFGLFNSGLVLTTIGLFSYIIFESKYVRQQEETTTQLNQEEVDVHALEFKQEQNSVPVHYQLPLQYLNELMSTEFFCQADLTVSRLAEKINLPEHQLRELINKHLGYRNFSAYLNSFRIEKAKQELSEQSKLRTPILTIALELGYGSIGPFNRAFKQIVGVTPSEYRKQHLKQI